MDSTEANVIGGVTQARVLSDWHDLPVGFVLWMHLDNGEKARLDSFVSQLDAAAVNEVLVHEISWQDEYYTKPLRSRHMRLGVRFFSDRESVYRSDGGWHGKAFLVIVSIVGLTANDLRRSDAAFMATEFAFSAWRAARQRAADWGYNLELAVRTDAAAALSVLRWILDNDSSLAENLKDGRGVNIEATDHGPFYVVSLRARKQDQLFLVHSQGGQVSRIPYSPSQE